MLKIRKALCLDLDGTVRRSKSGDFIKDVTDIELVPGIERLIYRYKEMGYLVLGISNQGGVAYGHKTIDQCNNELAATVLLFSRGNPFDRIEMSFAMEGSPDPLFNRKSLLRKPHIGMLAVCEYQLLFQYHIAIDWANSLFVGDRDEDRQCAENAGIQFYHIDEFLNKPHTFTISSDNQ